MSLTSLLHRGSAVMAVVVAAVTLAACSSGASYVGESDYVSPVAVSSAPTPSVPVASSGAAARRMPLLPPVPGEQGSTGLPPVNVASLSAPSSGAVGR